MNKVKEIGEVEEKEKIGIGSLWVCDDNGIHYILAVASDSGYHKKVSLVALDSGGGWNKGVSVNSLEDVSLGEWSELTGNYTDMFTRVHAIEIRSDDE